MSIVGALFVLVSLIIFSLGFCFFAALTHDLFKQRKKDYFNTGFMILSISACLSYLIPITQIIKLFLTL